MKLKIDYNAPVVLTFTFLALLIQVVDTFSPLNLTDSLFTLRGAFSFADPLDYFRLFSHALGHSGFQHLLGNSFIILLLGPILEEKYGSGKLLSIILITAFVTAVVNTALFHTGVRGASGVAFAFIVLASIVNLKKGTIPLTFVLVFAIHVGGEVLDIFKNDNISQTAHILGGIVGALAGFSLTRKADTPN